MRNRKKVAMGVVLSLGALTAFALGAPHNGHRLSTPFDVRTDTLRRTIHIARHEAGHAAGAPPGPGRRTGAAGSPAPRFAVAAAGPGFGHGSVTSRSSGAQPRHRAPSPGQQPGQRRRAAHDDGSASRLDSGLDTVQRRQWAQAHQQLGDQPLERRRRLVVAPRHVAQQRRPRRRRRAR